MPQLEAGPTAIGGHNTRGRRAGYPAMWGLLSTRSLSGRRWAFALALSLLAPAVVGVVMAIQLSRQRKAQPGQRVARSEA